MSTVEEAADTFAKDLQAQNIAGLMLVFTPEGMMKAMALQGQLQARAAEAMAAGRTPGPATGYSIDAKGPDGEDQVVHITLNNTDGSAEILTRWREVAGAWKVNDVALVAAQDAEGNPVSLG
jgi:hypothetical protein